MPWFQYLVKIDRIEPVVTLSRVLEGSKVHFLVKRGIFTHFHRLGKIYWENPELDPLAVLHCDNQLCIMIEE